MNKKDLILFFIILVILIITLTFYKNIINHTKYYELTNRINNTLIHVGFHLDNIKITGNNIINKEDILKTLQSIKNKNIFNIDLFKIHENLLSNKWVENVEIERILPNTIKIKIIEKKAIAIWQTKFGNSLITKKGEIIFEKKINDEANKNAFFILDILKQNPKLYSKIWSISYISKRRWDVHFKEGLTILLPKNDIAKAWKQIQNLHKKSGILEIGLIEIDIRNKNQILGKIDVNKKIYLEKKKLL